MGRHEQLPSWAATSDSAPNLPRALRRRRNSASLDWRRVLECLDRRQDVSLVEYGHSHGEMHRAITEREEASSAVSPEEKALASEPAPEAPRFSSCSPEAFLLNYFHLAAPAQLAIPLFHVSA